MKKKILTIVLALCATLSLTLFGTNLTKTTASAYTKTDATYTIRNDGDTFSVFGGTSDTLIESGLTSLESAMSLINSTDTNDVTEIVFDAVVLTKQTSITLSKDYLLSGSITSINENALFIVENTDSANDLNLTFEDFSISNTTAVNTTLNLIEVSAASNPTNITLDNAEFNHTVTTDTGLETNTHAIYFKSSNHSLFLKNIVSHSTEFFYNYVYNNNLSVDADTFYMQDPDTPLPVDSTLKISVPYYASSANLFTNITSPNRLRFEAVREYSFYEVTSQPSDISLSATANINISFDTNGATYAQGYTVPSTFKFYDSVEFPTIANMTLDHHNLVGWFGKITYQATTYYFDQDALSAFVSAGISSSNIPVYFKTSIEDFVAEKSFAKYEYTSISKETALSEYQMIYAFAELHTSPSFVAKWNINSHTINYYDSTDSSLIETQTYNYNEELIAPQTPTKIGHTFAGWFEEVELVHAFDFEHATMPDQDLNLFAKWTVNSYTITFTTNNSESILPQSYDFDEELSIPNPTPVHGYIFKGWFEYLSGENKLSDTEFVLETMPDRNLSLHAVWEKASFKVTFSTGDDSSTIIKNIEYLSKVKKPNDPVKIGYTFRGWFYTQSLTNGSQVVFDSNSELLIENDLTVYASWTINEYILTIHTNTDSNVITKYLTYGDDIDLSTMQSLANYTFDNWFADANYTTLFVTKTMPAQNLDVYAKWKAKPLPTIDESVQTFSADDATIYFKKNSDLLGFSVKYKVNDEWVLDAPTEVGSYDVLISRSEDNLYAAYSKVIKDGFVINYAEANFNWLIALLFVVAALEIFTAIVVRYLRKMKTNMVVTSIAITYGVNIIPSNQVVLLIISGSLAIFGFILMIYQFVSLHRTVPIDLVKQKDDESIMQKHFAHSEKVLKDEVPEYSASDIENLLQNDTVGQSIKEKYNIDTSVREEEPEYNYDDDENETEEEVSNEPLNENTTTLRENVEIFDDEEVQMHDDEETRIFDSEDPFVRRNPDDYSNK